MIWTALRAPFWCMDGCSSLEKKKPILLTNILVDQGCKCDHSTPSPKYSYLQSYWRSDAALHTARTLLAEQPVFPLPLLFVPGYLHLPCPAAFLTVPFHCPWWYTRAPLHSCPHLSPLSLRIIFLRIKLFCMSTHSIGRVAQIWYRLQKSYPNWVQDVAADNT